MQNHTDKIKTIDHIDIIMVGTTHSGNIGAAARAMHNMCFTRLVLVDPQCPLDETAYARSSGAHSLLDQCKIVATLQEAVADCHLVLGLTARHRSLPWPQLDLQQVSQRLVNSPAGARAALVFGREHSGLTNQELMHCHYSVSIPSNPAFSSLNVASAIQVICYEIYQKLLLSRHLNDKPHEPNEPLAKAGDLEGYFTHLEQVLVATEFMDTDNPGLLMQRLRRLYLRAGMSLVEVNILRGILNAVKKYRQVV